MNSIWSRVTAAAILSLSVFGATQYFAEKYRPSHINESDQKPIAFIQDLSDEVEKRPVSSLVWNEVSRGEALHTGEAVKTSSQGEVRIQFAGSQRFLDLDPDSLIVLHQENENEIALDLMSGSLFVSQNDKPAASSDPAEPALTFKSAQGKVDLSQATAQLSKSANRDLDVQVIKGKAKIQNKGQVQELTKDQQLSSLEILTPRLDQVIFQNPSALEPVQFRWKGFPDRTLTTLWLGKTRKTLKEFAKTESANRNSLKADLTAGNYFWKLSALDSQTRQILQESPVYRLKIENRYAPSADQPLHQAKLLDPRVEFKWQKAENSQSVLFELAQDSALKNKVFSKSFEDVEHLSQELAPGLYYWKLSSSFKDSSTRISTPVYSFTVGAPKEVEKPKVAVVISWLDASAGKPQFFVDSPKAQLAWMSEQKDQVRNWRLKLAETEDALKSEKTLFQNQGTETHLQASLPKPGRYLAMVEALDEKNQVLASSMKSFEISPLPLLPAPQFLPLTGDFKTDNEGHLNLKWNEIKGAKEYWVHLLDASGKEIRKARFERTSTALSNLLPGRYQISIVAVDEHGRESEKAAPRQVVVPDHSGLQAPKVKKIQVN